MTRTNEMRTAKTVAKRLNHAIAHSVGKPAGFARTYAQAIRRDDGRFLVLAYYEAGCHEENFTIESARLACDYFEAGGIVRMSVKAHLGIEA